MLFVYLGDMKEKILIAIIIVISLYATITTFEKRKIESQLESQITTVNDSIDKLNLRLKDLTNNASNWTNDAKDQSNTINNKLKEDEKAINNYVITDSDLADFIAKHESN